MKRPVIDAHLHLDESIAGPADAAVSALCAAMDEATIARAVLLHLESQRWSAEEISQALAPYRARIKSFINVNPRDEDAKEKLETGVGAWGYDGLKLHPRQQRYSLDDPRTGELIGFAAELGVPVLIDAFPDGYWLRSGFDPNAFCRLALAHPEARIIIAHMGGHHVLDFMMLAKSVSNLYFDCSFSLLYYRGSSVPQNMTYVMKGMRFKRIFYGSDYPDRPINESLEASLEVLQQNGIGGDDLDRILCGNAEDFFNWTAT